MATGAHEIADLFTRHGRDMARRARRILRSEVDAEDAVQEVMLSLLRAPHVLAAVERVGAWLYTLVRRRCVDIIRRDRLRERKETEVGPEELFEGGDPAELMERDETAKAVARASRRS